MYWRGLTFRTTIRGTCQRFPLKVLVRDIHQRYVLVRQTHQRDYPSFPLHWLHSQTRLANMLDSSSLQQEILNPHQTCPSKVQLHINPSFSLFIVGRLFNFSKLFKTNTTFLERKRQNQKTAFQDCGMPRNILTKGPRPSLGPTSNREDAAEGCRFPCKSLKFDDQNLLFHYPI